MTRHSTTTAAAYPRRCASGDPMTELADSARPVPHDEVRRYFEGADPSPAPWTRDIAALRRETRDEAMAVRGYLEPVATVETPSIAGVPAQLYRPARQASRGEPGEPSGQLDGADRNVLVWLHGGGWMHGDLDCYDGVARAFANGAGCSVLAVDYRLAPEHPFPA